MQAASAAKGAIDEAGVAVRSFVSVWDPATEPGRGFDSQADSHSVGRWQPSANVSGSGSLNLHLRWTVADADGHQKRGLQNRLEL